MANLPYLVVTDTSMAEMIVNKSRFIGVTFPVETIDDVKEALGTLKKSNKDAKHIAYAYLLGSDFSVARSNDDGEPAGSAGAPIYQAIREKKITNILVAVVRYFGGVELGKSRLTRTYYSAAANALMGARLNKMVYCGIFEMKVTYGDIGSLTKALAERGFPIIEKRFEESMPMIRCAIPVDTAEKVIEDIRGRLKDSAHVVKTNTMYYNFPI